MKQQDCVLTPKSACKTVGSYLSVKGYLGGLISIHDFFCAMSMKAMSARSLKPSHTLLSSTATLKYRPCRIDVKQQVIKSIERVKNPITFHI